ncbi:MAG: tetratricopeptide repeat protein, partial [Armatimonadetes bacterium]|nr:tetratricopeptide repeat protein [Armatimonadota bacterium]
MARPVLPPNRSPFSHPFVLPPIRRGDAPRGIVKGTAARPRNSSRSMARNDKQDADSHFNQALQCETKSQFADAVREYENCIKRNDKHPRAHLHLGLLMAGAEELDHALKEFQRAHEVRSDVVALMDDPGMRSYYQRKIPETLDAFHKPITINPANAYAHYRLGLACKFLGRLEQALGSLKTAMELNPRL